MIIDNLIPRWRKWKEERSHWSQTISKSIWANSNRFPGLGIICGSRLFHLTKALPLESFFLSLIEQYIFSAEQFISLFQCLQNFGNLTVFFHFALSLLLLVKVGSISADKTFSKNMWVSCIYPRESLHQTRGSSTDLSWIISSLFLASAESMLRGSISHAPNPFSKNLSNHTLDLLSRAYIPDSESSNFSIFHNINRIKIPLTVKSQVPFA